MSPTVIDMMQGPLCGTLATFFLYGVVCMQVLQYAGQYGALDQRAIKWLVWYIWLLETLHTAFSFYIVEYYLILHFDDPEALEYEVWSICATFTTGFLVALAVNFLFIWRIWQLSNQLLICIILALLAIGRAGLGIAVAILGLKYLAFTVFLAKIYPSMLVEWFLAAFTDSAIAITLCYYLHRQRSGIKRTDHIINTLLLYTINTGVLTSLCAIMVVITFLALPHIAFTAFVQVQSKLYAVSTLASLNARRGTLEGARNAIPTENDIPLPRVRDNGRPGQSVISQLSTIEFRKVAEEETLSPGSLARDIAEP